MSLESKIRSLKAHPLIQVLADNRGNPRTLVLIEPLWGVPYNLIAPFATLYMYTQEHMAGGAAVLREMGYCISAFSQMSLIWNGR